MKTIVCIGDSLSAGHPLFDPDPNYYVGVDPVTSCYEYYLTKMLNKGVEPTQSTFQTSDGHTWTKFSGADWTVIDVGIGSTTTTNWLSRFIQNVVELTPDYCIIFGNANDPSQSVNEQTTYNNYIAMVTACQTHGIIPILGTNLPRTKSWTTTNANWMPAYFDFDKWLKGYVQSNNIKFIDFYNLLQDQTGYCPSALSADGIHLSPSGYSVMGNGIDVVNIFGLDITGFTPIYRLKYQDNGGVKRTILLDNIIPSITKSQSILRIQTPLGVKSVKLSKPSETTFSTIRIGGSTVPSY